VPEEEREDGSLIGLLFVISTTRKITAIFQELVMAGYTIKKCSKNSE
jgi:hypothetical protein